MNSHSKFKTQNSKLAQRAFTLVELMIVVSILGILAAIIIPQFQGHIQQAKESAAKDNLRIFREAIERYALEHNGVPPGYKDDNPAGDPYLAYFIIQLDKDYLTERPYNPINEKKTITIIKDAEPFPSSASDSYGWVYKPSTKEIRLDSSGIDSKGQAYFTY